MIDSNNIDVMRQNIRRLSKAQDPAVIENLITNVEANTDAIGDLNSLVGSTPLQTGQTITSALNAPYMEPTDLLSGVTIDAGGYGLIGNLVVLNIRLNSANQIANNTDVCTLPVSGLPEPYFVQTLDQNSKKWRVVGNKLRTGEAIASGVSIISLLYLTYSN